MGNAATTVFMASWTLSTILLLVVGYLIDDYGFKDSMIVIAWLQMPLSLLLFWRIPSISLNDFTEIEMIMKKESHTATQRTAPIVASTETSMSSDLCIDLRIL